MQLSPEQFRYTPGTSLAQYASQWGPLKDARETLQTTIEELSDLQEKLYADDRRSLLLVFQGMDAAGKDSTIKHVTSGVNPMGFQVFNFKQPTYKELDHNYLWRFWRAMPERGRIGIFNRSYYEEVLVVRVHPEMLEARRLPHDTVDDRFWQRRYDDIRNMEAHLAENGMTILKFFLNVSKSEQRARLLSRLHESKKHWKFDPRDLDERDNWDAYQDAYARAIAATHTDRAPWFVIPADDKWTMRAIVARIVTDAIASLDISWPEPNHDGAVIADAIRRLESEPD
ncbi:MAG: polyphosphate kinase 2 family protein [Pseudomonadales bacterium]